MAKTTHAAKKKSAHHAPAAKPVHAGKFAFQCRHCGALEPAGAAGDNPVPGACHICRHGVRFETPGGQLQIIQEPENWIVLADLSDKELAELGLSSSNVVAHKHKVEAPPQGTHKTAVATERIGSKDRG